MERERPVRNGDADDPLVGGAGGFLAIGDRLARFEILNRLGVGGMGVVYVAHDPLLDRQVAVKVLRADAHGELRAAELEGRLLREAQAMARLSHPNVVTVHEVGIVDRQIFIVMELNDGGTMRAWLKQEARPVRERIRVFIEAGRGLAAAHAVRLVHRDFKPDNVLLSRDGRVRVVDFGLVRGPTAGDRPSRRPSHDVYAPMSLTMSGAVIGTPAYMAPEQHRAEVADHRSDQFSFCVALYEALYGRRPFAGETYRELVVNILDGSVLPPPDGAGVPLAVHRVIERGLASAPDDRYPGMTALLDDLAAASAEVGAQTNLASAPAPAPRRRRALALALSGGLVVAAAAVSLVLALGLGRGDNQAAPADAAAPAATVPVVTPVDRMDAGASDVVAEVADAAPTIAPKPDRRHSVSRTRKATSSGDGARTAAPDAGTPRDSAADRRRRILELND